MKNPKLGLKNDVLPIRKYLLNVMHSNMFYCLFSNVPYICLYQAILKENLTNFELKTTVAYMHHLPCKLYYIVASRQLVLVFPSYRLTNIYMYRYIYDGKTLLFLINNV